MSVRSFVRASPFSRTSETARSLNVGFGPPASRIRSARSRSRFRILTEGSGVVLRGIGDTKFAVSFSPGSHRLPAAVLFKPAGPVLAAQLATLTGLNSSFLDVVAEPCCRRARQVAGAVSAPPLWLSLRDWRLAVGSGLAPSIPVFRLVRDCSQHA